ncbi:sugar transferase [Amorphus coralli]|uniref:sugar transferase n=1 Tax=Amorphus coralli TaxID=340680 RepID=UPI00037B2B4A|nr:sugar transferase [Amorphus coralli]
MDSRWLALSALRIRYQLLAGLLMASVLPAVLRGHGDLMGYWDSTSGRSTVLGTAMAVTLGIAFLRQLTRFPGVNDTYYVLPSFGLAYGTMMLTFFLFRLDYSRFQFVVSFAIALGLFFVLYLVARRFEVYRFAVLPGVDLRGQSRTRNVEWIRLDQPSLPTAAIYGVIADLRRDLPEDWDRFITDCALKGVPVFHVKQAMESLTGRVEIEHLSENTLGSLLPNRAYLRIKELADWFGALVAIFLLGPFLLAIAVAIRLDSKGPALFRQTRIGYRGKPFTVYKLRTMTVDASERAGREAAITRDRDPRVTRIGRLLRRTRIDELPQIINILRGEMSWIGPRPEVRILSEWFEAALPFYPYRYIVRPGITGWAQINQGHVGTEHEVLEKLHYDFFYIKNYSLWLDILISIRTVGTVLSGFGAR